MIILCNTLDMVKRHSDGTHASVGFLLAQVGARAAQRFAAALEPLKFTPPDAGILRLLSSSPGISQQELARQLDMHASRLVAVIDALETRGLVVRKANASDRRIYALHLSDAGRAALAEIGKVAHAHNDAICSGLEPAEREQLAILLGKIAAEQGLLPGIHPGYRTLGGEKQRGC